VQAELEKCKDKQKMKRLRNKLSAAKANLQKAEKNRVVEEKLQGKDHEINGMLNIIEEELEPEEVQRIAQCIKMKLDTM